MGKSTIWGSVILLLLLFGLIGARSYLVLQRQQCQHQLETLAPALNAYAQAHQGRLPATPEEFEKAVGPLPRSGVDSVPYHLAAQPLRWRAGAPQPYLWDPYPHRLINGVHVLFTDGAVQLVEEMPKER